MFAVTGTKGYFWAEAETVKQKGLSHTDMNYSDALVSAAVKAIEKYGSFEEFVN